MNFSEETVNLTDIPYDYLIGQALLIHSPYEPDPIVAWNNASNDSAVVHSSHFSELNVPYAMFEIIVAVLAVIGNAAVIIVFQQEKRLRRRTNYYIVSLALADFLVGLLGIPFAIMASMGLPRNMHACLCTVSMLIVLCTISIFCLVAVSVDRYWAILYCISYNRNVSTRTAIIIISICWIAGSIVGFLPLFGWHAEFKPDQACMFVEVMDYSYLVFLYFGTIVTPAIILAAFYAHIYTVILRQVRNFLSMNTSVPVTKDPNNKEPIRELRRQRGGTMLRVLGAAQKREVKATQNLSIIVLFFMICWMPLYTINCINAFCSMCLDDVKLTNFCIILSHLNSALNPILYAYHLRDFRKALKTSMMRLCGMKLDEPEPRYRVSLVSQNRNLINNSVAGRSQSQPRIFIGSNVRLNPRDSPSPRNRHSTTSTTRISATPVVNLTVDTHCKIWQIVENEASSDHKSSKSSERRSPLHRIHSMNDVFDKDKDYIINYFATNNNRGEKESSPAVTDEGFHSNEHENDSQSNESSHNPNKKKLLFSSHAQFSRDFSLDDDGGVEESIVVSNIEPKTDDVTLPKLQNELYVKISSNGGTENDKNGSK
ncbi:D(1A) dopamine receptor-like [Culicoides brevitarsis]|uniref:D(1A) dopamine receptor-like n=1 Tax=Culicoides brevitarsis TaxID=469753 RepID=UPI00307B4AD4